jgi:hypothetical protein
LRYPEYHNFMYHVSKLKLTTAQKNSIKSDVCANRFYTNREEQKDAISEYLDEIWKMVQ